jgi:hypothetical protein
MRHGYVVPMKWVVIRILALFDYPDWGFSVLFRQLQGKCHGYTPKTGHGPHSSQLVVTCFVLSLFVLFCCYCVVLLLFVFCYYLCCSMYCLCVNVYCTTATGCLPNCSWQIYHVSYIYHKMSYQDGPLNQNLLTTQTMVTMGIFPYQEKSPW